MRQDIIEKIVQQNINKEASHIQDKENRKKIAVLFTDIGGSTNYIQIHGDQAGRLMLERHYTASSEIIHEFGGNVVKKVADSAMAYFLSPEDALKSAIKLQQRYYAYNHLRKISDQVHIRISVHFGYGIIEENDISRDAINAESWFIDTFSL